MLIRRKPKQKYSTSVLRATARLLFSIIQLLKTQHFSDISYQKSIVFETLNNFQQRSYFGFSDKIFLIQNINPNNCQFCVYYLPVNNGSYLFSRLLFFDSDAFLAVFGCFHHVSSKPESLL